jgi:Putative Ig domain/GxGYxYP putative glycoside hydrolase C-terminal domain
VVTPWNSVNTALGNDYATNTQYLLGVTSQNASDGTKVFNNSLPMIAFTTGYATTEASLESAIASASQGWSGTSPLFVTVQASAWNIGPTNIKNVVNTLDPSRYVAVRPDTLFLLYRKANNLATQAPAPWSDADVGAPALDGSALFNGSTNTWSLSGAGSDIGGTADQFHFAWQILAGDGNVVAQVTSQQNTDPSAKAGVVLRAGTLAGAGYAGVFATPGSGVVFQWRTAANGPTSNVAVAGLSAPVWVKLVRVGNSFSGFYSTDGNTWTQVGSSQTLTMPTGVYAGLGVSAHNVASVSTATFASVAVTPAPATALALAAPSQASTGVAFTETVSVRNGAGNTAPSYTGTVQLSASDSSATIVDAVTGQPLSGNQYTFVTNDLGQHQFLVTEKNSVTLTLTASATGLTTATATTVVSMVSINTATLSNWTVIQAGYSQTINASGGTGSLTFGVTAGTLPAGLTLSSNGVLSGTPTATSSYTFTVTATDSVGASASQSYTVTINPAIALSSGNLPADTAGLAYHGTVTASGGTGSLALTVSNINGTIPGLNVPASGSGSLFISGTPTASGTESFTVTATDTVGATATQNYTVVINPPVLITTSSLPAWTAGTAYQQTISASGGTGALTFAVPAGTLPPGLTLSNAGVLAGTASNDGSFTFTVTATDAVGAKGSQSFTLVINPPVSLAPATLPAWTAGVAGYSQTFNASGGTGSLTFSASSTLPPGLTLSSQGVLSGTPSTAGTYAFTVTTSDTIGARASQNETVTINASVTLNPGVLPSGLVNASYNQTLRASGGTGTVTLVVSNLSGAIAGLNVPDGGTGSLAISGTPTAAGTESFTVSATDTLGSSTTINYSITIVPATVYLSLPSTGYAAPPGGTISGFPISINQLQDQGSTNHVGLASATIALSFPTGVFSFPLGSNLASADVSLGSVPLSNTISPGGAADWNLSATAPADGQLNITLTAKSGKAIATDNPATGGGLVLVNFPLASSFNPGTAVSEPITVVAANGAFHTSILGSNGTYILKPTPPYGGSITIAPSQLSQYQVTVSGSSVPAGKGFLVAVQAEDQNGNPLTNYNGPATVTATLSPASAGSSLPTTVSINSSGAGWFLANIPQAGTYTITVADSSQTVTGSTVPFRVSPGPAVKLAFAAQPVDTPTGVPLPPVSLQVTDSSGNVVTSDNSDVVTLAIASGPGAFTAGSTLIATAVGGVATFNNLTLTVPGTYTLSAVVPGLYTGPNSSPFSIASLQVVPGSFQGTPSGFALQFNAPLLMTSTTPVLYWSGFGPTAPTPSVIVTTDPGNLNDRAAMVAGSLLLNSATNTLTFLATNTALRADTGSPVLPDGTYTVILRSSAATGWQALYRGGGYLDGLGTGTPGSGDYTQTFVVNTAAAHDDVLWVPATSDGPGQPLSAPGKNQTGGGYPLYLDDATGLVTSVQVTLQYDPALLIVSGVSGAGFSLRSSTPGQAVLKYSGPALPTGVQTPIGYLVASVPAGTSSSPMPYRAKDLLHLTNVALNGGTIPVATSDGLHLVAYVGDADGSGSYTSNDAVLLTRVALQADTGFAAYPLVDPVIVADTDGAGFLPADAALQVNEASVGFPTANLPIPPIPGGVVFQASAYHAQARVSIASGSRIATDETRKNRDSLAVLSWLPDEKTLSHFRVFSVFHPWPSIFADF